MAVCSEIHTKHINTVCGQNVEFLSVKPGGIYIYIYIYIVTTGGTYTDHCAVHIVTTGGLYSEHWRFI